MKRALLLPVPLLLLLAVARADEILVITPDEFAPALRAWKRHREAQGMKVVVRAAAGDLHAIVKEESPQYLLLLGDVKQVPCTYAEANTIRVWERDTKIATDNHLADLDGDDIPDLAVGRIPADSREEAEAMLGKVVAYETDRDFGTWRRRVDVVAGIAGFGVVQDKLIEDASTMLLKREIPAAYDLHVTWANPPSPFCPPPSEVAETVVERLNEGALIFTYMGHGSPRSLDWVRWGPRAYPIFDEDHVEELSARRGAPIVYLCCCSTGRFDGAPDCLAEFLLKRAGGPVAVIASSRVSMPYSNGVLSKEMLSALFREGASTVGDMLRIAKRRMIEPREGDELRAAIDGFGFQWKRDVNYLALERHEHLWLYNLLGDPSMRIPRDKEAKISCAARVMAGAKLAVEGTSEVASGEALVELAMERTADVPKRKGDTDEDFAKCYARANAWVKADTKVPCKGGTFKAELAVPADLAAGTYFVRVYVTGADGAALGARQVAVEQPARTEMVLLLGKGGLTLGWLDPEGRFTPKKGAPPAKWSLSGPRIVTKEQVKEILEPSETPPE